MAGSRSVYHVQVSAVGDPNRSINLVRKHRDEYPFTRQLTTWTPSVFIHLVRPLAIKISRCRVDCSSFF